MGKERANANALPLGGVEQFIWRHRLMMNVLIHAALFTFALLLGFLIRVDSGIPGKGEAWLASGFLPSLPFFVLLKLLIFGRMKLFRGGWRYAGIRDVMSILIASWWFIAIAFGCKFLFVYLADVLAYIRPEWGGGKWPMMTDFFKHRLPNGVLVLDFLTTVFLVSAARLGFRIYREERRPISSEGISRVLIVGAGDAAETILREILRMREERYRVIGLVDDDPTKRHMTIHGTQVLGTTADIRDLCDQHKVEEILIAIPTATQKQLRAVIERCSGMAVRFQSLPGVRELIDGRVTVSQIRPVDIHDLLGREAVELDWEAIRQFIRGRRVLITGAGGSIGSEMCRQVGPFEPASLILVEQAETPLYDIEGELNKSFPQMKTIACICDVYDRQRVMAVWETHRPNVVIHAAAHKHVPMMERNPSEAVKNNILGTRNVADASCTHGVAEFVMISTDKAVNPSSVMGASKRVAEIYIQALNGGCPTEFKAVRFGNVLDSSGSVVPLFRKQILAGGPVTVTHPEMTRYFMTIPEASQLVLQAAATGSGGQIFLLDMGDPIRILDLAREMITLSGFRPDEDIDIVFTGVRPGEKLFEELRTHGEDIEATVHPKVMVWKHQPHPWSAVEAGIAELSGLANCTDRQRIGDAIKRLVPEYEPQDSLADEKTTRSPEHPNVSIVATSQRRNELTK
ncbi:MAG: polysaccharide biosynthesis protein [Phycisphaerae bacterium]|nr:polysaccharide biosynthesis protein [Phycisphaerae bacterium]